MPAVVICPNGCKLQVPVRKVFGPIQCPKCKKSIFVTKDEIARFQNEPSVSLTAHLSSDLVEIPDGDITFLGGEVEELLTEIPNTSSIASEAKSRKAVPKIPPPLRFEPTPVVPPAVPTPPVFQVDSQTIADSIPNLPVPETPNRRIEQDDFSLEKVNQTLTNEEREIEKLEEKFSQEKAKRRTGLEFLADWFQHDDNPGVEHKKDVRWKAYSLAWAMVIVGVLLLGPVIYTMLNWIGEDYHLPLGRWSFLLIFFSATQFLYAAYLGQIPDWTTTRFISWFMLAMTVFSTFLLALSMLSGSDSGLFRLLELSIMDKGKICGWLLVMTISFGLMSYLCGRTSEIWMQEESRRAIISG